MNTRIDQIIKVISKVGEMSIGRATLIADEVMQLEDQWKDDSCGETKQTKV